MWKPYVIAAAVALCLLSAFPVYAACPDGFSVCNGNVCGPGTDCNPQLGECRPCCPAGSYRGVQPCCDCPGVGQGQACMNGTCESGCNVADVTVACGSTLSILPGALLGGDVQASAGTIDMQGILGGSLTAGTGGTVTMSGTCNPQVNFGGLLAARDSGIATMTNGCVGGVLALQDGLLKVTGGQIIQSIRTLGTGHAEIGGVTVGRLPDGTPSPSYLVKAEAQSLLELNGSELDQDVSLADLATLKLNNATVHGSINPVIGNTAVYPQQQTVNAIGGNIGGSVNTFTLTMTGSNVGGGVGVSGVGATGTIGNATIAGTVGAGEQAVVAVSGGTIGGVGANSAILSSSNATITGVASVSGSSSQVGSLAITGGTVGSVLATGSGTGPLSGLAELNGADVQQNATASDGGWVTLLSGHVTANAISSGSTARTPNPNNPEGSASLMEIQGGTVAGNASASNRGGLKLVNGSVSGNLIAANSSRVNLTGGTVQGNLVVSDSARATQSGGTVFGDATISGQRLTMTGGVINHNAAFSMNSFLIMQNGSIGQNVDLAGQGGVISAGTIGGNLFLRNSGQLDMSGGTVQGVIETMGSTRAIVTGGSFKAGQTWGSSVIDASGGTFDCCLPDAVYSLISREGSEINLSGNVAVNGKLAAFDDSRIAMSGGMAQGTDIVGHATFVLNGIGSSLSGDVTAFHSGIVTIAGGNIHGKLVGLASSTVYVGAGHITGQVAAQQTEPSASFIVDGGQIDDSLVAFETSRLTMNGGTVSGSAEAQESSKLTVNGGSVGGDVLALGNATVELNGTPTIEGFLKATGDGTINARGGTVLRAAALDSGTLNLSGIVFSASDVTGGDDSHLTMSGGTVGGDLSMSGGSNMDMSGGLVQGAALTQGSAYLGLTGGTINGRVESANTHPEFGGLDISGGIIGGDLISNGVFDTLKGTAVVNGNAICRGTSTLYIAGGTVHQHAVGQGTGTLNISSGAVALDVEAQSNSTVNLAGGSVGNDLIGRQTGKVNMFDGIVQGDFLGFDNSVITKTGGCVFGQIKGVGACTMNISGGPCASGSRRRSAAGTQASSFNVVALDSATLKFIGTDLSAALVDPNDQGVYSLYQLTGTLADGTFVSGEQFRVQNGSGAQYKLIPYVTADLDFDGDVDADDFEKFKACSTGPGVGPPDTGCERVDFDGDNDVDMDDYGVYQRCFSGVDLPPIPSCIQ